MTVKVTVQKKVVLSVVTDDAVFLSVEGDEPVEAAKAMKALERRFKPKEVKDGADNA